MTSLTARRSTLFSHLANIIKARGGGGPATTTFVMGCVSAHTEQLGETLLTDDGLDYFLDLEQAQYTFEYTNSADADEEGLNSRIQGAVNEFLFDAVPRLLEIYGTARAAQLDADLRLVRSDVLGYLHSRQMAALLSASHGPSSSAQTMPHHATHSAPAQGSAYTSAGPGGSMTRDDGAQSPRSGSHVDHDDVMSSDPDSPSPSTPIDGRLGLSSFAPFPVDDDMSVCSYGISAAPVDRALVEAVRSVLAGLGTFARFYARAKRDLESGVAARESLYLDFRGNCGPIARPFPDIDMLHEVVPDVVSIAIDIPFSAVRRLSTHPRPFPYLTRLIIDETNVRLWTHKDMERTVAAFCAYDIPELHFVNARRATVTVCSESVAVARTCVLVDDSDHTRYISFVDQRNFERYVSGMFVDGVSFMYHRWFWSSITKLTLADAMPENELPLLFDCFPKGLEHLCIWFDDRRILRRHEAELLQYRHAGCGCCAQLSHLTLTTIWPFEGRRRDSQTRQIPVAKHVVDSFLRHLHDGEQDVEIEVEGTIELVT